jgi:hypothetical protein
MSDFPRGAEYARRMVEEQTTDRGRKAEEEFNDGLSPAEYLEARGWRKREIPSESLQEGWEYLNFSDPIYGHWESLDRALLIQFDREAESMGGYENLMRLVDEHGVPAWELQY